MPRACVVVRRISGIGGMGGRLELERGVLDVTCYGGQPQSAEELRQAVRAALKYAQRSVQGGTLLHGLESLTSPVEGRDGDSRWPYVIESWSFLASETAVT